MKKIIAICAVLVLTSTGASAQTASKVKSKKTIKQRTTMSLKKAPAQQKINKAVVDMKKEGE